MLKNHGNAVAHLPQLLIGTGRQILPFDQNRSPRGLLQEVQAAYQRAFSGAGHTDNAVDIALIDFQIDVLQGFHPVFPRLEGFGHIFNLYDRLFHFLKPFRFSFCLSVTCGQMFSNQYCRNAAILPPVKGCRQNPAGFPDSRASFIIPHFF